jgi:thiamine-phosphate pyrophosphorylase
VTAADDNTEQKQGRVQGAPACGLYIVIPPHFTPESVMPKMRHVFFVANRSGYEKNMHVVEVAHEVDDDGFAGRAGPVVALARGAGFVAVVRGKGEAAAQMARTLDADGVLLDDPGDVAAARAMLGPDAIIGLRCGLSPERADEARAAGVDYVSFGYPDRSRLPPEEIVKLWAWATETPVLVEGPLTNDDIDDYVKAGATFFDAGSYILGHPEGIMQGTVNMLYAIDLALGLQS